MKYFLMIVIAITLFAACRKDEPVVIVDPVIPPVYGNLKVGNYWIYQHFLLDTNGVETPLNKYDTCYVEADTVLGGETYYKMIRPSLLYHTIYTYYWREKDGVIYDYLGKICFSSEDFTTIFETDYIENPDNTDTLYIVTEKMVDKDLNITTPAGSFVTRTYQTKYQPVHLWDNKTRYSNRRFSKYVGIVSETLEFYTTNPNYTERRLVGWGTH